MARKVRFSTSDLSRRSGDVIAEAMRRPVTITQRNTPRLVLLNIDDYEKLMAQADPRRAVKVEDMSDELFAEVKAAFEEYMNSPE